uniref:AlNc14C227G9240 protein n=1 Tax=Albugo laibachii Nc14 TaxID=890382 RepID=F0WSA1_9STRA|nr:AlNc14C227G9240 [Albugo laibachii Nc14]|eukprot:CCA24220.1 AlNc14C227G9240 [Albugo laibachii Nc14]
MNSAFTVLRDFRSLRKRAYVFQLRALYVHIHSAEVHHCKLQRWAIFSTGLKHHMYRCADATNLGRIIYRVGDAMTTCFVYTCPN